MIKSAQRKDWEMEARSNQFLKAFLEVAEQFGVFAGLNGAKATEVIGKSLAQVRATGGYDLVILDGPVLPWEADDRKLLETVDGIVAVLPLSLDINEAMEDIITSLGIAQRKLAGVILNELNAPVQRGKQYA